MSEVGRGANESPDQHGGGQTHGSHPMNASEAVDSTGAAAPNPFSREAADPSAAANAPAPAGTPPAGTPDQGEGSPATAGYPGDHGRQPRPEEAGPAPQRQPAQDRSAGATAWPDYPAQGSRQGGEQGYGEPNQGDPSQGDPSNPGQAQAYPQTPPYGTPPPEGNPYTTHPYESNPYDQNPYGTSSYLYQPGSAQPTPYQADLGGYSPYGAAPQAHPQAVVALILGIVGLTACPLTAPAALVLGSRARNQIDAEPYRYTGRGLATAGFILGIVGTIFIVLAVLLLLLLGLSASLY